MIPLLSLLLTAYNREQYITEAIESILNSAYQNFELIIVDDGSTDNTVKIAREYELSDQRIRVYVNSQNLGDYPNRNRAASYAKGKYLKYVDSDDRIYPETLSTMVELMEQYPEAGLGISDPVKGGQQVYPVFMNAGAAYRCHYFEHPIFFASPGQVIFKRQIFEQLEGFPEKRMVSDFEMWHKISTKAPLILMPGNLYWMRQHEGQEMTAQKKYIVEYEKIKVKYLFAEDSPLTSQEALSITKKRKRTLQKVFIRNLFSLELYEASLILKAYFFYLFSRRGIKEKY